jgi:hypothetical protein
MMITIDDLINKRRECLKSIDITKDCFTCFYETYNKDKKPCNDCYCEILGIPVNPTNWEKK